MPPGRCLCWLVVLTSSAVAQTSAGEEDALALVQRSATASHSQAAPPVSLLELAQREEKPRLLQPRPSAPGPNVKAKASSPAVAAASGAEAEGGSSCSALERDQIIRSLRSISEGKSVADSVCRTAVSGESCYRDTEWAMTDGFANHPQLYSGLKKTSSFEEFQMYLYKIGHANCPKPCMPGAHSPAAAVSLSRRSEKSSVSPGASTEAVFAGMPRPCTRNMTHNYGVNFAQIETCFQSLLRLSQPCSSCASELLKAFVGEDIFHMQGVCLPRCRPMAIACQVGASGPDADAVSADCLEKAAACMDCAKPSVETFLVCAGFPHQDQLHRATALLIEDFRNHNIVYPGRLDAVVRLAQNTGF